MVVNRRLLLVSRLQVLISGFILVVLRLFVQLVASCLISFPSSLIIWLVVIINLWFILSLMVMVRVVSTFLRISSSLVFALIIRRVMVP